MRKAQELTRLALASAVVSILLGGAAVAMAAGATPSRPAVSAASCRPVDLAPRTAWITSGTWEGERLLLVDARSGQFLSLSRDGKSLVHETLARTLESPARLSPRQDGMVVELGGDRFVTLNRSHVPVSANNIRAASVRKGANIDKVFAWAPAGGDLVAYADVREVGPASETWRSGFVRFPVEDPSRFRFLQAPHREPNRIFYRLGYPLMASLSDTAYILFLDNGIGLYKNARGSDELVAMDALDGLYSASQLTPQLPTFTQREDFALVMRGIERSSMPVGLYAWGNDLYVLSRSFKTNATTWRLSRVDPREDRIVSTVVLPSQANHLTVVPGAQEWAFIEKGPVRGQRDQDVNRVLFVPTRRILNASSGDVCR